MLEDAAVRSEHSKNAFREKVKAMLEGFMRDISTMHEDFTRLMPVQPDGVTSSAALAFAAHWKAMTATARSKVS